MKISRIVCLASATLFLLFSASGCSHRDDPQYTRQVLYPTVPPDIPMPELPAEVLYSSHFNFIKSQEVGYTESLDHFHFTDCEISIKGSGISVRDCYFDNCVIYLEDSEDIVFEGNVVRDLNRYEETALVIRSSGNISVKGCWFSANYIGLGIHGSSVSVSGNRFTENNGHNALVINNGSSVEVTGNYFHGSFPHAILVLNREKDPGTAVNIHHNIIEQTGEDAVNFEDYYGAAPSYVSNNIITDTGWSAILVEYNSWDSGITIESNWIERTGIDWELHLHPLNPEEFISGWEHGILIEDSSDVNILNNRIVGAGENGIEITNGRDITVTGNGISCAEAGIGIHGYNEASLSREFSPLLPEDAGHSIVIAGENTLFQAETDLDIDDLSEMIPTVFTQ